MNSFDLSAPNISRDDLKFSATINTMMVDDDIISDTICVSDDDLFPKTDQAIFRSRQGVAKIRIRRKLRWELYESVIDSYLKMYDLRAISSFGTNRLYLRLIAHHGMNSQPRRCTFEYGHIV